MGIFSDIPTRINGQGWDVSWWNDIKQALIDAFGAGPAPATQFTINDDQSDYAYIPDCEFNAADFSWVRIAYTFYRFNGTESRRESGMLELEVISDTGDWRIGNRRASSDALLMGDNSLDIDQIAGVIKVKYKSDDMGGAYVGEGLYKIDANLPRETLSGPQPETATQFTINDNQSTYLAIAGLSFDADDYSWVRIIYSFYRSDGAEHRRESGFLDIELISDGEVWRIGDRRASSDSLNILNSLRVNQTGDVATIEYKSDAMGGDYIGKGLFRIENTLPRES